jgi:uncharacterized RDD family membrane protein YckC
MFTIIGGDGKEYGPVTADQIRAWITAGRANLDTKAKPVGTEDWRRLGDFPEFAAPGTPGMLAVPGLPPREDSAELAGRGARLGASLLDSLIAFICCLPALVLAGSAILQAAMSGERNPENVDSGRMLIGLVLMGFALMVLGVVQIWMLSTRGQTLGKRILGIRIVKFTDQSNPGFVGAFLMRAVVPGIIGAIPYIGFIFSLVDICFIFREDRRCIHDLIAGTQVVKIA